MREAATRGWLQTVRGGPGATRIALSLEDRRIDRATLAEAAGALGESLDRTGLGAGDLVAVLAPPSVEGVALIHALLDRRLVLLPLNARLSDGELDFVLASSGARWLFVSALDARAEGLAARAGCGLLRFGPALRPLPSSAEPALAIEIDVEKRPEEASDPVDPGRRDRLRIGDAALVLYTSGTSGRPKGAVLSFSNLIASAQAQGELLGHASKDRWLLCMPLFHVGGLSILIRSALAGSCVVLHPRFDAESVSVALDRDGITHVSFVATMLSRLLDVRGDRRAPEGLRLVLLGGGPASQSLLERASALGYPIAPTYGLTEAASQVATRPPGARAGLAGDFAAGLRPLPGVEIRIVDADRERVHVGTTGEIEVRGPIVMAGYLGDPEATARVLRDGWLATGDLGWLDAEGRLRVLDRRSDLIISGGENVYPAEIESVLAAHAQVVEAGVVGIDDALYGQRPLAFVVWEGADDFDPAQLARWCEERLARFKLPVGFHRVESLPRTASGKLIRRRLASIPRAREERSRGPAS